MELSHIVCLALVQGLTEFLPVSSSAHLILVPSLLGWEDQGLAFDVAVHLGTLIAVVSYFRADIVTLSLAWVRSFGTVLASGRGGVVLGVGSREGIVRDGGAHGLAIGGGAGGGRGREAGDLRLPPEARLAWGVVVGTVPAALVGLAFRDVIEVHLRSPLVIATTTILFGLLLWYADHRARAVRDEYTLGWQDFLVVGAAQALALVPGTSRSGITITAGLLLGLTREAAARYSFLLSIPIIVLSGIGVTRDLATAPGPVDWTALGIGTVVAAISAYLCIRLFLAYINRMGMGPFVLYRLALGALLFAVLA